MVDRWSQKAWMGTLVLPVIGCENPGKSLNNLLALVFCKVKIVIASTWPPNRCSINFMNKEIDDKGV